MVVNQTQPPNRSELPCVSHNRKFTSINLSVFVIGSAMEKVIFFKKVED